MSETLNNTQGSPEGSRRFGDDVRLKTVLSKEFQINTKGMDEWNQIDVWRMQNEQLMHELIWIGVSQPNSFKEPTVAKPHDRRELAEALMSLVAENRFKPTHAMELHHDREAVERECDIEIGDAYWSMRAPFIAYWQGEYKPDAARRILLGRVIQEEKERENEWPIQDRAWQWIESYFRGSCPQDIKIPSDQEAEAVIAILDGDFERIESLNLKEQNREEILRVLKLYFLRGTYPIVLDNLNEENAMPWSDDEPVLQNMLDQLTEIESETTRIHAVTELMCRYRKSKAQGLNFLEEEEKFQEGRRKDALIFERDMERRREAYGIEAEFLATLQLPNFEAEDWPDVLHRTACLPFFKPNPKYREHIHNHIKWLIERMPWENEKGMEDEWGPLTNMLHNYWAGNYHPDNLRWKVLQSECNLLTEGRSHSPDGEVISTFLLHKKFIEGSSKSGAKENVDQDPIELSAAYENDMELIRSLELGEELTRRTVWEYNNWLLKGGLPIVPDREMPNDRAELEKTIRLDVGERKILEQHISSTNILQLFCDHWHALSKRPIPRKE